jgi:hypothetical protein
MVHIRVGQEVFSIVDELVATLESMFGIFEGSANVEPNVATTETGEQSPIDIDGNIEANLARLQEA